MIRDTVGFLRGEGRRVFLDAEHFFDGYAADRAYALEVRAGRGRGRRRGRRPVRHQRRACCRRRSPTSSPTSSPRPGARLGIHCHNDTGCAVANSLAAVDAGRQPRAGHRQRLRRAHRQRRPAHRRREPPAQAGPRGRSRPTRLARGDPDRPRDQRGHQRAAVQPPALRRRERLRAQGRPARQRHQGRPRPLPAHRPDAASATTCGCWCPTWPAAPASSSRPASSGYDLAGQDELLAPGRSAEVKDLELRGYTFDAADASFELLLRERGPGRAARATSTSSPGGSSPTPRRRRGACPRPPSSWSPAAGGSSPPARATARSTRSTTRCGRPSPPAYPEIDKLELIDFRVRILDAAHGTDAVTRVLIETSDGRRRGRRSASRPTSSRPPGRPSSTASPTACCARASRSAETAGRRDAPDLSRGRAGGGRMAG